MTWLNEKVQPVGKMPKDIDKSDLDYLSGDIDEQYAFDVREGLTNEEYRDEQMLWFCKVDSLPEDISFNDEGNLKWNINKSTIEGVMLDID